MVDFRMPSLGADMEAGTLVQWLVKPGDTVKRGDVIAVVETQKGAIEIEVFEAGRVDEILVGLDSKVPVGTPLARIRTEREAGVMAAVPPGAAPIAPIAVVVAPALAAAEGAEASPRALPAAAAAAGAPPVRVSPAARRLAQLRGVDIATISGSGPGGAIVLADIEGRVAAPPGARKPVLGIDLNAMRTAIAAAMARSKREIPHYYLEHQVDITACEQWLTKSNTALPPESRLLMGALTLKAVALAARRFSAFNGFYQDGKYEPSSAVHVGVAIAVRGGGLAAPALHDVDGLPLPELMTRLRDLVQRMRAGRIRSSEIADATITASSLGERGVEALYGIIYPPQVALVGFGKVVQRPWIVDGAIGPRSVVTITLAGDHRVSDGHAGALFLAEIGGLLQQPNKL
jgi:pyruvate dehydrogenase E2 component (dihydrolipoamide acetyltransferase)